MCSVERAKMKLKATVVRTCAAVAGSVIRHVVHAPTLTVLHTLF